MQPDAAGLLGGTRTLNLLIRRQMRNPVAIPLIEPAHRPRSSRAVDADRRRRQRFQALVCDFQSAAGARSVQPGIEALLGGINRGKGHPRFVEKSGDLLTLPCDRVAFWIVFVIGGDVGRGIHNVVEASFKTCCVPSDHCALLAQPGPGIGRFVLRTRWVISHYPGLPRSSRLLRACPSHRSDCDPFG